MWGCTDNQDVGSEAAIIERVRNSLLVECPCADNVRGLKSITEAADVAPVRPGRHGRGVFLVRGSGRRKPAWSARKYGCRYK